MSEQATLAAKVHEILSNRDLRANEMIYAIESILPAPALPTLANMNEEARESCQWMQADVEDGETSAVILNPHWEDGSARLLWPGAIIEEIEWEKVTPRPDLPRMAWPTDEKPATTPALPDGWRLALHQGFGRIIVTNATTHRGGYVGCLLLTYDYPMGFEWHYFAPGELTYIRPDQEAETLSNWYPMGPDWEFYTPPF